MSKLEDALTRAVAGQSGKASTPAAPRADATAELVTLLAEAMRAAAAQAIANAPAPQVIAAPAVRPTAWRMKLVRKDGLLEELILTPEDPNRG